MPLEDHSESDTPWGLIKDNMNIKEEIMDIDVEYTEHHLSDACDDSCSSLSTPIGIHFLKAEIETKTKRNIPSRMVRCKETTYSMSEEDIDKPYKCTICPFRCKALKYLHGHLTKTHCKVESKGKIKCTKCSFETASKLALFHHILSRDRLQCPPRPCDLRHFKHKSARECPNCLYGTLDEVEGEKVTLKCWVCRYGTEDHNNMDSAQNAMCFHCNKSVRFPAQCLKCSHKFHVSCLLQAASGAGAGKCKHVLDPTQNSEVKKVKRRTKKELWHTKKVNQNRKTKNGKKLIRWKKKPQKVEDVSGKEEAQTASDVNSINESTPESVGDSETIRLLKRIIKELEEKNGLLKENCELWKNKALYLQRELKKV